MVHELILTSVSQGLNPDDRGFCPVAADESIPPQLIQRLLPLSIYQHINPEPLLSFPPNPPVYSHLILEETTHVLSRIAAAGIDYQHQPNVLAHHIIIDSSEFVSEGPGWLLGLTGFHMTEWNGPAVRFRQGRHIPSLTAPPSLTRRQQIARQYRWLDPQKMMPLEPVGGNPPLSPAFLAAVQTNHAQLTLASPPNSPCPAWRELTGDAGWGGVLAETVMTGQPVAVLFKPGQNLLPLFIESLALLPKSHIWQTTFSTYFTGLPEDVPCQWKGILAGSREAEYVLRNPDTLLIDLTAPFGETPDGRYTEFARSGYDHLLPSDSEEFNTSVINSDTKPYEMLPSAIRKQSIPQNQGGTPPTMVSGIRLPHKPAGFFGQLLRTPSRLQFYILYGIMFAMVSFLLVLVLNQSGCLPMAREQAKGHEPPVPVPPVVAEPDPPPVPNPPETRSPEEVNQERLRAAAEHWAKSRREQQKQLQQHLQEWEVPEYLPMRFPAVKEGTITPPDKTTFAEFARLYPFASALELEFVPLLELPEAEIVIIPPPERGGEKSESAQILDDNDRFLLTWEVHKTAKDGTDVRMFDFEFTETGLNVVWQPEGLAGTHFSETVLLSLGFLRLSATATPEGESVSIPLFAPTAAEPMPLAKLADLKDADPPEHRIKLPFADEPWASALAERQPDFNLLFEPEPVDKNAAENKDIWLDPFQRQIELRTAQQSKTSQGGSEEYQDMWIPFAAECTADAVVWKDGGYADSVQKEKESAETQHGDFVKKQEKLKKDRFDGIPFNNEELTQLNQEIPKLSNRIKHLDDVLKNLPKGYDEIRQMKGQIPYRVYLESPDTDRKLLILKAE